MFVAEFIFQELHEKLNRDCEVSDDESKHLPYKLEIQTSPILLLRQRLAPLTLRRELENKMQRRVVKSSLFKN